MGKIIFTIIFVAVAAIANGQQEKPLVLKGNELYKKQEYEKAAEEYLKATELNSKNPRAQYNLGNALYKVKKTAEAEKAYSTAAKNANEAPEKSKALYNKGVSLTRQNKLQESIVAYKQTLRINPEDEQARENLQKALNEIKKQPQQKQNQDNNKQNKQDQQEQPKNNSKLSKKQVEQMLNSLRQDEKKLQQNIQKRNNVGGANSKDW